MNSIQFQLHQKDVSESESTAVNETTNELSCSGNVTSFDNISLFLATHKYPSRLNLNQKRTLRKAATNFSLIDGKLYYIGKCKKDKRLVILDEERKRQVFEDCHGTSSEGGHGGQKKTIEKIESLFFWRGMVKDIVTWIQACEICRLKEEKRNQLIKKSKLDFSESDQPAAQCKASAIESLHEDVLEAAKCTIEQIQLSLQQLEQHEIEIKNMSKRAELDIDDVLDLVLCKIIKLVSTKRRELKTQVNEKRKKSLALVKTLQKQLEERMKATKRIVSNLEKSTRENQAVTLTNKSLIAASTPEILRNEEIGGIWTLFHASEAIVQIEKIIMNSGSVYEQPPITVSDVLELPGSLRLSISQIDSFSLLNEPQEMNNLAPRCLRIFYCVHNNETAHDPDFHQDRTQIISYIGTETQVYLDSLEPRQMYAIYSSYREEELSEWSPWSFPFLKSTSIPPYSWDAISNDWLVSADLREATKIVDSPTPLYSSSAQYFPGCRIHLTFEVLSNGDENDGFALIDQWVQGGSLNQEGTLFLSTNGRLYVNGKFAYVFDPPTFGSVYTFDCEPRLDTADGDTGMKLIISSRGKTYSLRWGVRNHDANVYFGVRCHQQGARVKVK